MAAARTFLQVGALHLLRQVIDHVAEHRKGHAAVKRDALCGINPHADHDDHAHRAAQNRNPREPRALVLELREAAAGGNELLSEAVVGDADAKPHSHCGKAHDRSEDHKHGVGGHDARSQGQETAQHAESQGVYRHAALIELSQTRGHHAVVTQGPHHAAGSEKSGVGRRQNRRDDHKIEDVSGVRDPHLFKNSDKGALRNRSGFRGQKRCDDKHRAHKEDDQAQKGGAHRHRDHLFGVVRFARGNTDQFRAGIGKADRHHGKEQGRDAVGQKTAFTHEVRETGGTRFAERDHIKECAGAQNNEDLDRHHFDDREEKLAFSEKARIHDIQKEDDRAENQAPGPDRHLREPVLHGKAHGRESGAERYRPVEPIQPRHGIA